MHAMCTTKNLFCNLPCFATSPCISCLRDFESPQPLSAANLTSMTERSQVYFLKDKKELFFLIIFKIEVFAINEFAIYLGCSNPG